MRARSRVFMGDARKSNLNSNRRGLPSSPQWPSCPQGGTLEKRFRLKAIVADQSAGCWVSKQEGHSSRRGRQMSLIVGLVQFPVAAGTWCTAAVQCLEANPVSSIGVLAAQSSATKLPAANGSWGHCPTCPLPKSTLPFVKSLPPFPSSHRRQT